MCKIAWFWYWKANIMRRKVERVNILDRKVCGDVRAGVFVMAVSRERGADEGEG